MSNYITRAEVHAAADQVDANGKKPTSTSVRGAALLALEGIDEARSPRNR